MKRILDFKRTLYDKAVNRTLIFYEKWVLPDNDLYGLPADRKLISLREAKLKEFRERKALLHPYERTKLLENADENERARLKKLVDKVNPQNCLDFTITYDRHRNMYGDRIRDFPKEYEPWASVMEYKNDPYARDKFKYLRLNLKTMVAFGLFLYGVIKWREARVSEYDRLKRIE